MAHSSKGVEEKTTTTKATFLFYPSLVAQMVKESARNAGDSGSIPELERVPEEGNGKPFQYSRLENSMDRGAWQVTVHGVAKSQTQLKRLSAYLCTVLLISAPAALPRGSLEFL